MNAEKPHPFPDQPGKTPPRYQERVHNSLLDAGFSDDAAIALLSFDLDQFHYMRRVMKGDVPAMLMQELGSGLEAKQFHALTAITRIQHGIGRAAATEATVGLLAEELNVDPSRASRIVADLVERGYLQRGASQLDGRRSILTLTEAAIKLFEAFRTRKWQKTMSVFKNWPEGDILAFARLFARYSDDMRAAYPARLSP
ncbi:MAG: MarR family transcriptional regulator [Paracoccaceae bacterium]